MKKLNHRKRVMDSNRVFNFRIRVVFIVVLVLFGLIIYKLFNMIIINRSYYNSRLYALTNVTFSSGSSPRGRIYDRNNNLLVDNKSINDVVFIRAKDMTIKDLINKCYLVIDHLDLDYSKTSVSALKEFWSILYSDEFDKKVSKEELNKLYSGSLSSSDIYNLKIKRISNSDLSRLSDKDRKASYIYYLMNNGYSYDYKVIKKDLSALEYAYFSENKIDGFRVKEDYERLYLYGDCFRNLFGNLGEIPREDKDKYLKKGYNINDVIGSSYLEYEYEDLLKGVKDKYKVISSSKKELISKGKRGKDIVLSIDIRLQQKLEEILKEEVLKTKREPNTKYYNRSFAVITDPKSGEILAMAGVKAVKDGNSYKAVDCSSLLLTSPMTVGSVVKGASILVGYNNNAIKIGEVFRDECVKLAGTSKKCSWRTLGVINDIKALALSSNVYQFKTAMRVAGYKNYYYNMPFKVSKDVFNLYRKMYNSFGLGVSTGIDLPIESLGYHGKDNQAGLLFDFVMGQYETYTPIQLAQYIATMANNGTRLKLNLLKEVHDSSNSSKMGKRLYVVMPKILNKVDSKDEYIKRVQEGFYAVVNASYGIGHGYIDKKFNPAGKTGTSQSFLDSDNDGVIDTETISTAFIGYAPYNDPKMSIVVTSPDISYQKSSYNYTSYINKRISKKITDYYFELYPNE